MSGTLKFRNEHGQWQEFRAARGRVGPPGPQGPPGTGVEIQGVVQTEDDLPASGDTGHAWMVVEPDQDYYGIVTDRPVLFVWDHVDGAWVPAGPLQGEPGPEGPEGPPGPPGDPATATPLAPAGGANGTSPNAAREDHNHDDRYALTGHHHGPSDIIGVLSDSQIPSLDAGKIGSGTLSVSRIPNLDASKITSGTVNTARIPNLDASKITSGAFPEGRIPNLPASKITSGQFHVSRIPGLPASTINSGTFHQNRIPPLTLTHLFPSNYKATGAVVNLRVGPGNAHAAISTIPIGTQFHAFGWGLTTDERWHYVMIPSYGFGWFPGAQMEPL